MASIYKRNKKKKNEPYVIQYLDHHGDRKTESGFTDKGLTEQLAARLEDEARQRRTGLIDPEQEEYSLQKKLPLADHLVPFERHLKKNSPKHVTLTMTRVNRIIDECEFQSLGQIKIEDVEEALTQMLEDEEIGHRTYNHYIQAFDSFCNWCVASKRLLTNPLLGMERLNTEVDIRHPRRALKHNEISALVQSARESGTDIQCFTGEQRARIYILSYMTGLRRKEIASLTPRNFDLTATPPLLTVEAACAKSRRKDVLPLHPDLVEQLKVWFVGVGPETVLFPKLAKRRTWLMVKKDLERIDIPYETPEGIADFHAAGRHTHITGLMRSGATLPEAQKLARHTDIKMTMKYTHIGIDDQARAVAALPALQMRCISGGGGGHSVSAAGTKHSELESRNPGGSRGSVDSCHLVALGDKVEAAGSHIDLLSVCRNRLCVGGL